MGLIASVFQNLIDLNKKPFAGMPPFQYEASTSRQGSHQNEREQPNAHSLKRSLSSVSSASPIPGQGLAKRTKIDPDPMPAEQFFPRGTRLQPDPNVVWTLTPHGEQQIPSHEVLLEFDKHELVAVLRDSANSELAKIKLEALKGIASVIDEYAKTEKSYRDILKNRLYRAIYKLDRRQVFYATEHSCEARLVEETGVCQECKIVLPWETLTVDHQRPQSGGGV